MEGNGQSFLKKVFEILKDETASHVPLIQFKHPKELQVNIYKHIFIFYIAFNFLKKCLPIACS